MNTYIYRNNKDGVVIAKLLSNSILEADKAFEETHKLNPVKHTWIGCQITFNNTNSQ